MNDELIRELSEKLGVNVESLWPVLVAQANLSAYSNIFIHLSLVAFLVVTFFILKKYVPKEPLGNNEAFYMTRVFFILIFIISFIQVINSISSSIVTIINPEYWALMKIKP